MTQWFFISYLKTTWHITNTHRWIGALIVNTTLAREQVWGDDRHCERCGTPVIKKDLDQWFFRTTRYADELLKFDDIDWPERVRTLQTNWIGRSEGASVTFNTEQGDALEVFTTRPDTLWGATFMVMAPEHPLVAKMTNGRSKGRKLTPMYCRLPGRQMFISANQRIRKKNGGIHWRICH